MPCLTYNPIVMPTNTRSRSNASPVRRLPLRDEVYRRVRDSIIEGTLTPGQRLSDSVLAEQHGVSRTPIREALFRLESDGLLASDHLRGFFVTGLTIDEAEATYPILCALESLALTLSPVPDSGRLRQLRFLNSALAESLDPVLAHERDEEFHRALCMTPCNPRLQGILETLRRTTRRYEISFMRGARPVQQSVAEHEGIVGALARGRQDDARRRIERHWQEGLRLIRTLIPPAEDSAPSP